MGTLIRYPYEVRDAAMDKLFHRGLNCCLDGQGLGPPLQRRMQTSLELFAPDQSPTIFCAVAFVATFAEWRRGRCYGFC
jgi:hypothetical protein